ncbi:PTS system, beta-glucosides-specific IIC component [Butyrivibrio sp. Su6]|uniref:PTS sugar transporter subunit IIA n=1 Tax=Butyrivibrio sp. Su6 TaxID=1520810 RepID=UPI00089EED42|nr:PTS glucose transporter subunit IIA [Butyrivibrio sp. Su6]SEG28336.1 PTS system, beta-glucosides-specific IIC component [Butyrivibrio sp. Su6]
MGLLDKLFKGNSIEISSPVNGELVPIETVSDPTFAQEMIGKGVAIQPSEGKFYAPADGKLMALFPTGHAYAMTTKDGAEILVHIGIDTVKLNGEHYTIHAKQGDDVKKGDLIVEVDLEGVKNAGFDTVTPVIISNSGKFSKIEKKSGVVSAGDTVILLTQ